MTAFMESKCCFPQSAFYAYVAIIPFLAVFVMFISFKVYGYYSSILTMESRLLERKVKKLAAKIGKSSKSDPDRDPPTPVQFDPMLNTDSTNKLQDKIPIHLVQSGRKPKPAADAAVAGAKPAAAPGSGPQSEEPLSPRTPVKDPATNDEVTEISGYSSQPASSDHVLVSPQDTTSKLPDMSDLPSISTIEPTTDGANTTSSLMTTTTTSNGKTNPATSIPPSKKSNDRVDTLKMLDDSVYGLKTEIISPDVNTTAEFTNDPFQTYVVPKQMLNDEKPPLPQSNLQPTTSDANTTHPVTNPHLRKTTAPSARLDDVDVYIPPDHSPVPASTRADPVPAPSKPEPAPNQRARPSYQHFDDSATMDPLFTPSEQSIMPERRARAQNMFDLPPPTHHSPFERNDRHAKPSGYFSQRARSWLADNRDSDSVEEK